MTVSFSKYLPWQAMHFLQRSTYHLLLENVLQTVDHFEISCLGAVFSWLEKPRNRVRLGKNVSVEPHQNIRHTVQIWPHTISGLFQPRKGRSSEARNFEVINGLQHVFEKWVERCKKCIACQGRYFEKKRPSPHLHKIPTRSNKVSPRTFQTAVIPYTKAV
jgi:hypothetical protein